MKRINLYKLKPIHDSTRQAKSGSPKFRCKQLKVMGTKKCDASESRLKTFNPLDTSPN